MKHSLFIISICLLCGCTSYTPLGRSLSTVNNGNTTTTDLRRIYGPPNEIIDNAEAGKIWLYERDYVVSDPGYFNSNGYSGSYTAPSEHTEQYYLKFWINTNQTVYNYSTNMTTRKQNSAIVLAGGAVSLAVILILLFSLSGN
jgi:hypothetical protein